VANSRRFIRRVFFSCCNSRLIYRVFLSCCGSVAWSKETVWPPRSSTCDAQGTAPRQRPGHFDQVPVTNNCRLTCRVSFSCCDSVARPQAAV
jgi:hypothetical protein